MGDFAEISDVQARIPKRLIDANTDPNTTQVELFITGGESKLLGAIAAGQYTAPESGTPGFEILTSWATTYAEGHTRMAYASAGGDGDNDDGKDLVDWFDNTLIPDMLDDPSKYEAMLTGGAATQSSRVRSYTEDNEDDKSKENGDFQPVFKSDPPPWDIF